MDIRFRVPTIRSEASKPQLLNECIGLFSSVENRGDCFRGCDFSVPLARPFSTAHRLQAAKGKTYT